MTPQEVALAPHIVGATDLHKQRLLLEKVPLPT